MRTILKKYSYAWVLSYFFIYLAWFNYLEKTITADSAYTSMYSRIDSIIPFCEIFVIPYTLWFAYVAITVAYFLITSKEDFLKLCAFLFIGMSICLLIYTIFPNGQDLRPTEFARDNFLVDMCKNYYKNDTPTNVFPSIHCLNSIGVSIAILSSKRLHNKKFLKISTTLFSLSIMASTVFIKQHSILDMFGAIILSTFLYVGIYMVNYSKFILRIKNILSNIKITKLFIED